VVVERLSLDYIFQRATTFGQALNVLLTLDVVRAAICVVEALRRRPRYIFLGFILLRVPSVLRSLLLELCLRL
jgi:hypothetical protein